MENILIDLVRNKYPDIKIKTLKNGDANLTDFPVKGIHARIKPNSGGVLVFVFHQFVLLNIDYKLFEILAFF